MIANIKNGDFDVIITKELLRLARNVKLIEWTKQKAFEILALMVKSIGFMTRIMSTFPCLLDYTGKM